MVKLSLLALAKFATALTVNAANDHWAVLIAGSSGYGNYRHQADVCHAYQVLVAGGYKAEHIITLAVDDIANAPHNPYPGQMFNKPTAAGTPGVDVYAGCQIDYSGTSVTPETFVSVLTGNSTGLNAIGSGKVLQSTSNDRVFVNFVDHGGVGIIGFPRTLMHAKELIGALTQMHTSNMYKELVFYLEACESGSMFQDLPANIHMYTTTAANAKESSWGTYCPPDDKVNGKTINSCLGDLYSVKWMEDADLGTSGETLQAQFDIVKKETNKSHVLQFGDLSIASEPVTNFEGKTSAVAKKQPETNRPTVSLPSENAALSSAFHQYLAYGDDASAAELIAGVQARQVANKRFNAISRHVAKMEATALPAHDGHVLMDCHYAAHKAYKAHCGEWAEGTFVHSKTLAQLCKYTAGEHGPIVTAIAAAC